MERYSKNDCETAMKYLTKHTMITTTKTTRGMIVTICKYDYYQNPTSYESYNENRNKTTRVIRDRHTINKNEKNEKKDTSLSPEGSGSLNCPHSDIIKIYHTVLPMLPQVKDWHDGRQEKLRARWKEDQERQSLSWWQDFFEYVRSCPHLIGQNNREWKPNLEWLVERKNFVKIIEGNYEKDRRKMAHGR
jgi:hypothetical protein